MVHVADIAVGFDHRTARHPSLAETQVRAIEAALQPRWAVDRHMTCEGGLALMLTPPGALQSDTTFYVDAEDIGMVLSSVRDEQLEHLGCYGTVESLNKAIRSAAPQLAA